MTTAMTRPSRRDFLSFASTAMLASFTAPESLSAAKAVDAPAKRTRVLIGSHGTTGFWRTTGIRRLATLTAAGVAAKVRKVAWLAFSHGHEFVYSASELDSFEGKPTGEVASFRCMDGKLQPLSARNSAGTGTCHVARGRDGAHAARRRLYGRQRGQLSH